MGLYDVNGLIKKSDYRYQDIDIKYTPKYNPSY